MKNILKKTKHVFFKIEQRVPYIPDFSDAWTILKVLLVSFLLCVIYSFSEIQHAPDFYLKFIPNLREFAPYVISQVVLLICFAKLISRQKPFKAIMLIIVLNFIGIYIVHSVLVKNFVGFFNDIDTMLPQFFVSFGILFFFLIYFDWREKNLDPANTLAKLIFLQSKMKPHFLFNTLNSVIALMKKDPDTAKKMLLNLSELLRASIKEEEVSMYPLKDEISLCEKYLEIEKIRLTNRLEVNWIVKEDVKNYHVPRLCLQPLIENSVLHGIENLEAGGKIEINIHKILADRIVVEITNPISGKKATNYSEDKHNNVSIENLIERLNIYYDGDVVFKKQIKNGYFYTYMEIPAIKGKTIN